MYLDNQKKFFAVCNGKTPLPQLLNALGHCTVGLVSQIPSNDLKLLDYQSVDGHSHGHISTFPYIILKAKNSNQIFNLRKQLMKDSIPYCDFVETMLGLSADDQLQKTKNISMDDSNYFCLLTFADASLLHPLTKKFSLFK